MEANTLKSFRKITAWHHGRKIEPKKAKFCRPNSFYSFPKNLSYSHKNWEKERKKENLHPWKLTEHKYVVPDRKGQKSFKKPIKQNHYSNQECLLRNLLLKNLVQVTPSNPKNTWSNYESLYVFIILHFQQTSICILKDDFWHIFLSWSLRAAEMFYTFMNLTRWLPGTCLALRNVRNMSCSSSWSVPCSLSCS